VSADGIKGKWREKGVSAPRRPRTADRDLKSKSLTLEPVPGEVQERFKNLHLNGNLPDRRISRILVRAPNWVGDAVMSLPVLTGLNRLFPHASVTMLASPRVAPLYEAHPYVTEIIPYPPDRRKWRVLWTLRSRRFDLALALPNSLESALGLWLAGARHRLGYNTDGRRTFLTMALSGRKHLKGLHQIYYYLGLLKAWGGQTEFAPPMLYLKPEEIDAATKLLNDAPLPTRGPLIGLSPGAAYGPAKRWRPERFAGVADRLQEEFSARFVLLGGPGDREAADQVATLFGRPLLNLAGRTSLREAMGVLSRLSLLITNDSGLMHAAAALGVPIVALFGSTDPVATGPFTEWATVLHHPLDCSPCLKRTCEDDYRCLTAISVDEVVDAARRWLVEAA